MFFNQVVSKLSIVRNFNWVKLVDNESNSYVRVLDASGEIIKVETIEKQILWKTTHEVEAIPITQEILLNIGCIETTNWEKIFDENSSYVIRYWPNPSNWINQNPERHMKFILKKDWSSYVEIYTLHQLQNFCELILKSKICFNPQHQIKINYGKRFLADTYPHSYFLFNSERKISSSEIENSLHNFCTNDINFQLILNANKKEHFTEQIRSTKEFVTNTQIRMYDGSVKLIEEIRTGDRLLNSHNTVCQVQSTYTGQKECYNIHQYSYGKEYGVTKDHIQGFVSESPLSRKIKSKILDVWKNQRWFFKYYKLEKNIFENGYNCNSINNQSTDIPFDRIISKKQSNGCINSRIKDLFWFIDKYGHCSSFSKNYLNLYPLSNEQINLVELLCWNLGLSVERSKINSIKHKGLKIKGWLTKNCEILPTLEKLPSEIKYNPHEFNIIEKGIGEYFGLIIPSNEDCVLADGTIV